MNVARIKENLLADTPITRSEGEWLFNNGSDSDLQSLASIARNKFHSSKTATYLVMAIVNYTNICVAKCSYCSFFKLPHQSGTYLLSFEQLCQKIDSLIKLGGTLVSFNGGFHPKLKISDYAKLFEKVHNRYPNLSFFEMTVAEFMFSCKLSRLSYAEGARVLKSAGTQWVTGGGAEILDDEFRNRHSPGKFKVADYFTAQQALLEEGLSSTATMVIGFDESLEERWNHLEKLREFQDQVEKKLPSFLCWTYKPWNNTLGGKEIATQEYLRWLAVSRIYLHNFKHIRTSVLTQNERGLEGLKYGADDFDIPTEDEVTQKAGATISHDFKQILACSNKNGFEPLLRAPFPV